jgi:hypothetical protein
VSPRPEQASAARAQVVSRSSGGGPSRSAHRREVAMSSQPPGQGRRGRVSGARQRAGKPGRSRRGADADVRPVVGKGAMRPSALPKRDLAAGGRPFRQTKNSTRGGRRQMVERGRELLAQRAGVLADWADRMPLRNVYIFGDPVGETPRRTASERRGRVQQRRQRRDAEELAAREFHGLRGAADGLASPSHCIRPGLRRVASHPRCRTPAPDDDTQSAGRANACCSAHPARR